MLSRILVPLDGSPTAETVIPQVVELAELRKAEIVLLRVALAHTLPGASQVEAQVRAVEEAQTYLAKLEEDLVARGLTVSSAVRYGHAAEEILDHARSGGVGLIAMSTHGRSGIRRWVMGSVAEAVARRSPIPVLLLRAQGPVVWSGEAPDRSEAPPTPPTPTATPVRVRHVLCPVDLSPAARPVLETAGVIAERFGAALTVLHAVYDPLDITCSHIPHPPMEELRADMIRIAEATLRRQMRRTLGAYPQASLVVVAGTPYQQIIRFARTHAVDLIIMGTKGSTGLEHFIMGSTAEQVVRTAPCPVLSLRAAA
jgi:nucleotide-binding universal stress UspA family protein